MRAFGYLFLALRSLRAHMLRSILAIIGIVIGIGAVLIVVAVAEGDSGITNAVFNVTLSTLSEKTATVFFALAAIFGHASYTDGNVSSGAFVLTVIGFGILTLGGWLGGAIVFTHGMRVLNLVDEPAKRAAAPVPYPEKEQAEA